MKNSLLVFSIGALFLKMTSCGRTAQQMKDDVISVKIGDQVWTAANINFSTFRNGDLIPKAESKEEWVKFAEEGKPAWCFYNDNEVFADYGILYNWYAISDSRGLCPEGWHIPSTAEWEYLLEEVGGDSIAGTKLKDTTGWNLNGDNSYHFSIRYGGYRWVDGGFEESGVAFWCLNGVSYEKGAVPHVYVFDHRGNIELGNLMHKGAGLPCRCIKD